LSQTGYDWKIKRVTDVPADVHLGGKVANADPNVDVEITEEAVTGQYELGVLKPASVLPKISFNMKVQRLSNFVADKTGTNKFCFVSAEGALTAYTLYATDGLDAVKLDDCLTNSCEVSIPIRGSMTARIESWAKTRATQAYGSDPDAITDAVMDHTNVDTCTIGETSVASDFQTITFGVNHNLDAITLGNTLPPSEVIQKHTKYMFKVERALKTQSWAGDTYSGTAQDVILQINDNQETPEKTEFTWSDMYIKSETKRINELDLILETIECWGKDLALAEGS